MPETFTAIYENGVLRPTTLLDLPEHAEVQVTIKTSTLDNQRITRSHVEQALAASGLLASYPPLANDVQPLSEEERIALAQRLSATSNRPLSEVLIEEHDDRI